MKNSQAPPPLPRWVVRIMPDRLRDTVLGDLQEEWNERIAAGWTRSNIWFAWHAARVALRLAWFDRFEHKDWVTGESPRKGDSLMETLLNDFRYGIRMLARAPGFTLVAILTLALGIGANTAIFSIVNSILLRPQPVSNPEQLVQLFAVAELDDDLARDSGGESTSAQNGRPRE